jgi:hypothetical protein
MREGEGIMREGMRAGVFVWGNVSVLFILFIFCVFTASLRLTLLLCIRTGSCKQFPPFVEHKGIVVAKHRPLRGGSCPMVLESSNIPHGHPYVHTHLVRMHQRSDAVTLALAGTVLWGPVVGCLTDSSRYVHPGTPCRLIRGSYRSTFPACSPGSLRVLVFCTRSVRWLRLGEHLPRRTPPSVCLDLFLFL